MKKMRESNYDLLRIMSAVAVIVIHVSATWMNAITNENTFGVCYQNGILATCIYNVLSRFAVPCFIMLSGAFILTDERNADYKYFYRKTFVNIGVPTLLFSIFYFVYSTLVAAVTVWIKGRDITRLLSPIKGLIKGEPFYHMWYLYMMIGVYLLVPIILLFKKQVGEKIFGRVTWIFLLCASFGYITSKKMLNWDIGFSFRFVGYLMAGYELRKNIMTQKSNKKGMVWILIGMILELFIAFAWYRKTLYGEEELALKNKWLGIGPLAPLIVIASICIFAGFSYLELKKDFGKMSALTFYIYLFHAGVWSLLAQIVRKIVFDWDNRILIPGCIIIVFIISVMLSKLYLIIWNRVEHKWNVLDKLCKVFHL